MSRPAAAAGSGADKQPAEAQTTVIATFGVEGLRLQSPADGEETRDAAAAAVTSPSSSSSSSSSSSQSPAQRCAADSLGAVFSFLPFAELPAVLRVCRQWLTAGWKEKARDERFRDGYDGRLSALCASRSPLRRHIRTVLDTEGLATLRGLAALPALAVLAASIDSAELDQLVEQRGPEEELRAAFSPRLRHLILTFGQPPTTDACQLLLDALPVMQALENFSLTVDAGSYRFESVSLEPLLQLMHLTDLRWIGQLSVAQLQTVKQLSSLRRLDTRHGYWIVDNLAALCCPPHRLQQLEYFLLDDTTLGAPEMAQLIHLPGLTELAPYAILPAAFPFLPRLPRLAKLRLSLSRDLRSDLGDEQHAVIDTSLRACPNLTSLSLHSSVLTEEGGARLVRCVPQLRELYLSGLQLPSLHFLSLAPKLVELKVAHCGGVQPSELMALAQWAPGLERLSVLFCPGLQLDECEVQQLTPPSAALPRLEQFGLFPG